MIRLVAVVENPIQRENLRQCLNILGLQPCIYRDVICMYCPDEGEKTEKFIELFEQYARHEIHYE